MLSSLFRLLPALLLCAAGVRAGEDRPVSRPGVLHLTLSAAIQMALEKNFTIQVQEFNPRIQREFLTREWGVFDPLFSLGGSRTYSSDRNPITNLLGDRLSRTVITRNDRIIDSGISGLTPIGTEYRFGFDSTRNISTGQLFENYTTGPSFGFTQPVLRGFGTDATMVGIRIARNNVDISEWTLRNQIINTLTDVVYTYNELYFSEENLKVAIRSRELARQLLQDNTRRVSIGTMSPLDITTARAEVASREEGVILAGRKLKDNEVVLKQLVTSELEPMLAIRVEIDPPPFSQPAASVHAGIRQALDLRPDYRSELLSLQNRHVNVAFTKNQALPRVDIIASLGFLGFDRDFANSFSRITQRDSLTWTAGATFSIPLGNHAARGSLNAARLEAAQTLLNLKRIEQQIVVDVEIAAGQITSGRARIESTTESSRLAKESLDAGEQRLRAGTGTTFEVLELQKKLIEAESAELRARADHNKAVAEFYRKTGRTLQVHRVEL